MNLAMGPDKREMKANEHLKDVDLADEIVLLLQKRSDMQNKMNTLKEDAGKVGLNINYSKTKSMTIGAKPSHFKLSGSPIETIAVPERT